jgi:hypothetical protein
LVLQQVDPDYQIGIRRGGVRKDHVLSTTLVDRQDGSTRTPDGVGQNTVATMYGIQVEREFEKAPYSMAGCDDIDLVALHRDGSCTTFDAALQEPNATEYSDRFHYRLGAPLESILEGDDVALPSLQDDNSTGDVDMLLHESGATEHGADLGRLSTQPGRVGHMDADHDSTQPEHSSFLSEMGVEVPRDSEGAQTINSSPTISLTTSNSTINSVEKSPDANMMAKFVTSTCTPEKTTTIPVLVYFSCYVPDMDYNISTDMLQLWPSLWAEPRNISPGCIEEMGVVADCLCAAELYVDAFDLYYVILAYEYKSSFIFDDMRMHSAVLNCARTSATISQDNCAIALLRFALRWHVDYADPKPLSDHDESTKQRFLLARVMHLYLDDLYVKRGRKESDWRSTRPTCALCSNQRCDDGVGLETIDARLPNRHRSILTAETLQRKLADSWGIGYNNLPIPAFKRPATVIQDSGVLTKLLVWCSVIIRTKAESLEKFTRILPQSVTEAKELVGRLLFCHFLDRWLKERNGYSGRSRAFKRLESSLAAVQMSPLESLSAAAFMIVGRDHWNSATSHGSTWFFGNGGLARKLLSNLHRMVRVVSKSKTEKRFAAVYLRLYQTVGEDRNNSLSELSQRAMKLFARNIVSTGRLSRRDFMLKEEGLLFEQDRRWPDEEELAPVAVDFPEYTSRPPPLADMLFTPRSSFSSGARSFRIYHAEISGRSIYSLSTRSSKTALSGMSMHSHSSLSFSAVTGLPPALPILMDTEDRELEAEKICKDLEDETMVDIWY